MGAVVLDENCNLKGKRKRQPHNWKYSKIRNYVLKEKHMQIGKMLKKGKEKQATDAGVRENA